MLIVRSPVRISFGGGGTDLPPYYERYGGLVLSAAINKYFYTILTKRADNMIQIISADLRVMETWQDITSMDVKGSELEIPLSVMKEMGRETPVNLFLASEIPPGTGLGSSASVCVSILKALSSYLRIPMSKYELADKAFHIARETLGRPIGKQDEYAAAFGGINYIAFHPNGDTCVEALSLPPEVLQELQRNLMLFFTGRAHNSWSILKAQEQSTKNSDESAIESLHHIRELAKRMQSALVGGDLNQFGVLLDEGWQAKRKLSDQITNPRIDYLYQLARANGAAGGKITGAGGGGFLLLYCDHPYQQQVSNAFLKEGLHEMTFEFDFKGASVLVNDPFLDGDGKCGMRWNFAPYQEQAP